MNTTKFFIVSILSLVLVGCIQNKNRCFEVFGSSILWNQYLSFKFDNEFKQNGSPNCTKKEDSASFSVVVGVVDERLKGKNGNSAVAQFNLFSFSDKLDLDQVYGAINLLSQKYLSEAKYTGKTNARFSHVYSKTSPLIKHKDKVCRIVVTSSKDYKAVNMPIDQKYLLQNDFYKTCFLKDYNQIIILALSYRITPDLEKTFWQEDITDRLNSLSLNIVLKDGKSLADIIKFEKKEMLKLKKL